MKKNQNVGIELKKPKKKCNDKNCPFHGNLKIRGIIFEGNVKSIKSNKTAVVEWPRQFYFKKYERFGKKRTKIQVHNPSCIDAKEGDHVKIMECRPISKTKNFIIIEKK